MPNRYAFIVLATPQSGREEEYVRWHRDEHVPSMLSIPGLISCTRHELANCQYTEPFLDWRFMSIYEFEADDPDDFFDEMKRRSTTGPKTDAGNPARTLLLNWRQVDVFAPS